MCVSNMNAKASELGCQANDMACLCNKKDYRFGVRDCTTQACPDDNAAEVVKMALSKCPSTYPVTFHRVKEPVVDD